jgi:hypothetical protein
VPIDVLRFDPEAIIMCNNDASQENVPHKPGGNRERGRAEWVFTGCTMTDWRWRDPT